MKDPTSGNDAGEVEGSAQLSDARATADALREEKEQLARILATAPGAFLAFRMDPNGKATCPYGNAAVLEVYGLDPKDLAQDAGPVLERIHPLDVPQVQAAIGASAETLTPYRGEYRYVHPRKGQVWIRVHSLPTREADGSTLWLGFIQDVTDRRRAEDYRVQTRKLEALSLLANGIAHDFNNLLVAMAGNCALAMRSLGAHEAAPLLGEVEHAIGRAADLVYQLQGFGSPYRPRRAPVDLGPVVEEVVRLQRATAPASAVLAARVEGGAPKVYADPGQLHQMALNLVRNALQALPRTGGRVLAAVDAAELLPSEASATPGLATGLYARLTIQDDGVGMDDATQERIFDPYFTTKPAGAGSGLGLAMVRSIVSSHDGVIQVESAPGAGTVVRVYLPAAS